MSSSFSLDDYESDNQVAEEKDYEQFMSESNSTKPITGLVRTNSIAAGEIFERKSSAKLARESESMRQLIPRQESMRSNLFGFVSPERFRRGSDAQLNEHTNNGSKFYLQHSLTRQVQNNYKSAYNSPRRVSVPTKLIHNSKLRNYEKAQSGEFNA